MDTAVILNSFSGRGRAQNVFNSVQLALQTQFGELLVLDQLGTDNSQPLRHALNNGIRRFIIIGGDGTLHRFINLLTPLLLTQYKDKVPIEVGIINAGTGRDFARNLNKKTSLSRDMQTISAGHMIPIDIGAALLNGEHKVYFINSLSVGIGGETIASMRAWHKKYLPSKLSYLLPGLIAFFKYQPEPLLITIDGIEYRIHNNLGIMICNGQFSGGGMQWSKTARINDQLFEAIILPEIGLKQIFTSLRSLINDSVEKIPGYKAATCEKVSIIRSSGNNFNIEMDGELFVANTVNCELLSNLYKVFCDNQNLT